MTTPRFEYLCRPFAQGLLDKARALAELDLNQHQRARLRESVSVDVRKLCDLLVPDARLPEVSTAAAESAAGLGVDLRRETWHSQPKFDPGRARFHYEHMNPVGEIVSRLGAVECAGDVVALISESLRLAWITKEEDRRLTALGFRQRRPDPAAAYARAGITLLPTTPTPGSI
ncbi:hypothetical protein [Streptomyces sp. L2]|uniref:hypothetical protein n=1 Tax=Streptomyces sp. L2 TaxID=2162665 RepID=UPI0010113A44|nr:hypothetical protein [Streptomyces sp. L2]